MKGQEPTQERDARSYGDQEEMFSKAPSKRMKRRSKRGMSRKGRRSGRR